MFWITLDQIECFHAVVTEGSFTKAADKVHKAKSAVMYSVKNLEEQLGFSLFKRDQYRPIITPKGEAFFISSQSILKNLAELHNQTKLIASDIEMRLRISASGIFNTSLLYPVIKKAMHKFPSTEIIFEKEILSGEKMLSRELVDLAIFENLNNKKNFDYKIISKVYLKLVIAKNHDFLSLPKKQQTKSNLYHYPQIIQRSTIPDDDIEVGVHKGSLKWKVTDTPSKKEIILNGLGWGRLPTHTIEKDLKNNRLYHLAKFDDDDSADIYLCKQKDKPMGKVAQYIWDSF